jgi:hypothetical protein
MNIFTQFFKKNSQAPELIKSEVKRELLRREAAIGRNVFGPIPAGTQRDFFRVDNRTWIWQETWRDNQGIKHSRHTKYNVLARDIVKSVNSGSYESLTTEEAKNFAAAVKEYASRVKKEVYQSGTVSLKR